MLYLVILYNPIYFMIFKLFFLEGEGNNFFRMTAKSLSTDGTEGELAKNQATISIIAILAIIQSRTFSTSEEKKELGEGGAAS